MTKKTNHTHHSQWWLMIGLAVILLLAPFFRGAFFTRAITLTQLSLFLLAAFWLASMTLQGEKMKLDTPMDWVALALIAAYLLPILTFQWANLENALGMVLWQTSLLMLYRMLRSSVVEKERSGVLMDLLLVGGIALAITGLLALAGYVDYDNAVMGSRVASTFQYPNTLAALLMTLFFIGCGRQLDTTSLYRKTVYTLGGWVLLLVFVLTYSRAAWLLFPIMAFLYWILIPRRHKLAILFTYIVTAVPLLLVLQPITGARGTVEEPEFRLLLIALGGAVLCGLLYLPVTFLVEGVLKKKEKLAYGVFVGISVIGIGFMLMAYNTTEALVFENPDPEERNRQTLTRNIPTIYPGEYQLELELDAKGGTEDQWPWLVDIHSLNEEGGSHHLFRHLAEPEESGTITFDFSIPEEGTAARVVFISEHPETSVTFRDARIVDEAGDLFYQIPLSYTYLPEALVHRFESIDRQEGSASTRIAFYRDGLAMFLAHPLVGQGGGAWEATYEAFQSEPYTSRLAHNYPLQTIVETGIIGLLALLAMAGFLGYRLWHAFRKEETVTISLLIAILSLLAHSILDFNFSYFSIAAIFWALLALIPWSETEKDWPQKLPKALPAWGMLIVLLPLMLITGLRYSAFQQEARANFLLEEEGDVSGAYQSLSSAVARNPFHPRYRANMVELTLHMAMVSGEGRYAAEAREHLERGMFYAPNQEQLMPQAISFYSAMRETEAFKNTLEEYLYHRPLKISAYETVAQARNGYAHAIILEESSDKSAEEALALLQRNLDLIGFLHETNERAERPIQFSGRLKNEIQEAQAILSTQEAPVYASFPDLLYAMGDENAWRARGREEAQLETRLSADGLVITNSGTDMGFAYTPNIELEPDTDYKVWVDFVEISLQDPIRIHVIDTDSEDNRVQHSHIHDPAEDGLQASFTFTTTEDIEAGSQYVRFDHPGKDEGRFAIRGIVVYEAQ